MSIRAVTSVWHTTREGTQKAAEALPDVRGLTTVKEFVRRHPVLSTCAVLAVSWYILGGSLPRAASLLSLGGLRR
jgi:hypothetical protein